jgi:rare lipoprotein A
MTVNLPRSATWIIWPALLVVALGAGIAIGWSWGVNNGRTWAARELEPEIRANADHLNALSDRLIYLTEWATMETWASHYGGDYHNGRLTASGTVFDENELTAASPWLPFGKRVRVTNISNGKSVTVRITDRGPHMRLGRGLDLSTAAARELGMLEVGLARVELRPGN